MKQKMKQLPKIGILTFAISLFIISCSNENVAEIEQTETQQLQNKFTLDNFDDVFVKNYLEIDWDDFKTNPNSESELISYEFNAYFKVKSTIEDYAKYKLLASKDELNDWNFEIVKFSTSKENTNNDLSYFSIDNFTGSIYHYNLNGENTLIKVYSKGKITEEISAKDLGNVNPLAKAPADGGTHCTGCWTLVRTDHFTDWYTNSGGGTTLYYSHSTYDGASTEWVYIPSNGDYYGMPYDPEDGSYHNHYDYPHGGGSTDNHNDEDITDEWIEDVTQQRNLLCGSYTFSSIGDASVANISGLGMSIRKGYIGIDAEFSSSLCITIANCIPAHASALFNSAWNVAMSEVYTYLNATYTISAPTPEQLKAHILSFLNTNLALLEPGSIVSSSPCSGSIPTTGASYCP